MSASQGACCVCFRLKGLSIEEIYEFPEQAKIVKSLTGGHKKGSMQQTERFILGFRRGMCSEGYG